MSKNKGKSLDLSQIVYQKTDTLFEVKHGVVTIIRLQDHWIQRFLRKLKLKIPKQTKLELDAYGSFVFLQIDGKKDVYQIGQLILEKFDDEEMLYERLLVYLNHLEKNEKIVEQIDRK